MEDERKELQWGVSPFAHLTRPELETQAERLYNAGHDMHGELEKIRAMMGNQPYWSSGSGGRALEKGAQALEHASNGYTKESLHRAFFRYVCDGLYEDAPGNPIVERWCACDVCNEMVSTSPGQIDMNVGQKCNDVIVYRSDGKTSSCPGTMRSYNYAIHKKTLVV